jgi:hypothetical protein
MNEGGKLGNETHFLQDVEETLAHIGDVARKALLAVELGLQQLVIRQAKTRKQHAWIDFFWPIFTLSWAQHFWSAA